MKSLLILLSLCCSACLPEPLSPLRIGTNVWPGYEPFYLARELGYLDETPVRMVEYPAATEVVRALRNKAIEAGAMTLDEALSLAQYGLAIRIVLVTDISNGADVVLGKPSLKSIQDIKGARVGVENGALGAYVLSRALQQANLKLPDVEIVPVPATEQERAYRDGKIDAVVTMEPQRTRLLTAGARKLFDSSEIPGEIVDVLVVRDEYAAAHPEELKKLLKAWFRALKYTQTNPFEAASHMAKREEISPEQFQTALQGLLIPDLKKNHKLLGGQTPELLEPTQRLEKLMVEQRLLSNPVVVAPLFDARFLPDKNP